jgi:hypothetical protein
MRMKNFWILGIVLVVWGCKTTAGVPQLEAVDYSGYQEDLSVRLPDFPDYTQALRDVTPTLPSSSQEVDGQLGQRLRKNYEKAKSEPYVNGFTILVYSGVDRNEAFKTKDGVTLLFPDLNPEMQYQQPRYLVKVGSYGYKIEAQPIYYKLKAQFPSARIIQDRFLREEYTISTGTNSNATGKN